VATALSECRTLNLLETGFAMRHLCIWVVACWSCVAVACAARQPAALRGDALAERLTAADRLLRDGCFDCFAAAYEAFDALQRFPAVGQRASAGAVEAAILMAAREAELGIPAGPRRQLAYSIADASWTPLFDVVDALPSAPRAASERELARRQLAFRNRQAFTERLGERADENPASAYLWIAFNCSYGNPGASQLEDWLAAVPSWRDSPLIRYKAATCRGQEVDALHSLLQADARFVEIHYPLGVRALADREFDPAIEHFRALYDTRPEWAVVPEALANAYFAVEDFAEALAFFDRTLDSSPDSPDALLGKARTLTHLGRYADAIAGLNELVTAGRWFVGDARYWRAFDEMQLSRYDEAWVDVEEAARYLVNADVPKLAGIIAFRRRQFDVARTRLEDARRRNAKDCETAYQLGLVMSEQRDWTPATRVLDEANACLDAEDQQLTEEIGRMRTSDAPPSRRDQQVTRRERQLATNARMRATSWFNSAVAFFYLSRLEEAKQYAERVAGDEQLGARARALLSRLDPAASERPADRPPR
jgi:tetratricopeptide (TPR) repeat protein